MFPEFFNKIGNMPGEHSIILNPNVPPVQHWKHKIPLEAKEEIRALWKEMTPQDIIIVQAELTP